MGGGEQRATRTAGKQGVRAPAAIGPNWLTKAWVWLGTNELDQRNRRVDGIRDRDAAAFKSHSISHRWTQHDEEDWNREESRSRDQD